MKFDCPMCGIKTNTFTTLLWAYDNGDKFYAGVCPNCVQLHNRLTSNYKGE